MKIRKNKTILFANEKVKSEHSKRKKIFVSSAIIVLLLLSTVGSLQLWAGGMFEFDDEISWNAQKGDVYYLGFMDDYYKTDRKSEDDFIRNFRTILKSEILDVKDLKVDWDDQDDLVIMSSWLYGDDESFAVEFPNWFDIYQILMIAQNLVGLGLTDGGYSEVTKMYEWAIPNAIHFQCSSIYYLLSSLIEKYKLEGLGDAVDWYDFPSFSAIGEVIGEILMNEYALPPFEENFESYNFGTLPSNSDWEIESTNIWESLAEFTNTSIISGETQTVLNLSQTDTTDLGDYVKAYYDIWKYISETHYADRLDNLEDYMFLMDDFNFDLGYFDDSLVNGDYETFNETLNHLLEISVTSKPFNINGYDIITQSYKDFNGYNGVELRIANNTIQFKIGDYVLDEWDFILTKIDDQTNPQYSDNRYLGDDGEPFYYYTDSGIGLEPTKFRESHPYEKGWHTLTYKKQNISDGEYYDTPYYINQPINYTVGESSYLSNFDYKFDLSFEQYHRYGYNLILNEYNTTYVNSTYSTESINYLLRSEDNIEIPSYIDCPYDFIPEEVMNLDNPTDSDFLFRYENWTNLEYRMESYNLSQFSSALIDNIFLDGELYWKIANERDMMIGLVQSSLAIISFYHLLFFPNQFSWETIKSIFQIINELIEIALDTEREYITIYDNEDYLKIIFDQENLEALLDSIGINLAQLFNFQFDTITVEDEILMDYTITFDKRIGCLNESIFTFEYVNTGITRETGLKLIACSRQITVEKIVWLVGKTTVTETIAIYEDYYPATPPPEWTLNSDFEEWKENLITMAILGYVLVAVISIPASLAIISLGKKILNRVKKKRGVEEIGKK